MAAVQLEIRSRDYRYRGQHTYHRSSIACAIEKQWGGGEVTKSEDRGRIEKVGVENLRGESEFDKNVTAKDGGKTYYSDESHAIGLLAFSNAKNCWARDLTATHFYHGV